MSDAIESSVCGATIKVIGVGGGAGNAVLSIVSNSMLNVDYITLAVKSTKVRRAGKITC